MQESSCQLAGGRVLGQVITWPSTLPPASWQELSCIEYPKGCRRME